MVACYVVKAQGYASNPPWTQPLSPASQLMMHRTCCPAVESLHPVVCHQFPVQQLSVGVQQPQLQWVPAVPYLWLASPAVHLEL